MMRVERCLVYESPHKSRSTRVFACFSEMVWDACLHHCLLYVYCNMTPINLVDGLIIITNCGCGDLKPVSLRLPDNQWVLLWLGGGGIALIF